MTRLDARALNRAALARQFLLERSDVAVLDAVSHLGGLQAQEPQEPFTGLWSRLRAFDPAVLSDLLVRRRVVRTHLMRRTVHLVTADDLLAWRTRHDDMLRRRMLGVYRRELDGVDLDELASLGRDVLADGEPRTVTELGRAVAPRWPEAAPRVLGDMLLSLVPTIQLPPRGVWGSTAGVRNLAVAAWLGREVDPPVPDGTDPKGSDPKGSDPDGSDPDGSDPNGSDPVGSDPVGEALVRRYLAAFGPAASADLRAWCGLAGLPTALAAVRGELVSFRDERGPELLDLPDAPRPDPDTPAPVRFLPAFDNAILGYDDRSRIVDDAHRGLSVAGERVVLVDGRVAATWTAQAGVVTVTPLRRFSRADRTAVAEEGRELASFLSGGASPRVRVAASPR